MVQQGLHSVILPKSDLLKKYVYSFNVLNAFDSNQAGITYHAFPQSGTEIVFFKDAVISMAPNEVEMDKKLGAKTEVVFLGKYLTPFRVNYKCHVPKIAIHFTETGVINFFPNYYTDYAQKKLQSRAASELGINGQLLFSEDLELGLQYLEDFLLARYSQKSLPLIELAAAIFKEDTTMPTVELADRLGMNRKTFSRQFKKHVGCTATEFKRITRFKKTARKFFDGNHESLAQLCYDNGYYDASDFYKQIRKTTRLKPKDFFKNIKRVGPKNRIFIFE